MIPIDERVIFSKIALFQTQQDFKISGIYSLLHKRALTEEEVEEQILKIEIEYNEKIDKLKDQLLLLRM